MKKCRKCQTKRTKLEPEKDLIGNIVPNSYVCIKYWNGCRDRILKANLKKDNGTEH